MHRNEVFVAGGQPTVTYVERSHEDVEQRLKKAIAAPNQVVSLSGPTKTGKTVLCRRLLQDREYIWIDGGQISDPGYLWNRVAEELRIPSERETERSQESSLALEGSVPFFTTASGSHLRSKVNRELHRLDSMNGSLHAMKADNIILVIDDFHYISEEYRTIIIRNLKGAVFNGLKVILLSVSHRVFDATKAEPELTGRFTAITLPDWELDDLKLIAKKGFEELGVNYTESFLSKLANEAQESPFLMQKFCWEICFNLDIESTKFLGKYTIPDTYDLHNMFKNLSADAGLPIYQKLSAGPQSRKAREKRPLQGDGTADIYQAVLLALAETGPAPVVSYDDLRASLSQLLVPEKMPQKHEVTSALKQLAKISKGIGSGTAVDWDEDKREVNLADPYLRFYLRWQVRHN